MREQNPLLYSGPGEHLRIARSRQADVLRPHDVEIPESQQEAAQHARVDVLVGSEA